MRALKITPLNRVEIRRFVEQFGGEEHSRLDDWLMIIDQMPPEGGDVYFVSPFDWFVQSELHQDLWMMVPESKLREFCRPFELPREPTTWFDVERIPPG
jgi:hypothetical protein